jgi:hypothetical protein
MKINVDLNLYINTDIILILWCKKRFYLLEKYHKKFTDNTQ